MNSKEDRMSAIEIAERLTRLASVPPAQCDDESGAGNRNAYSKPQCPGCAFCDALGELQDWGFASQPAALAAAGALKYLHEADGEHYHDDSCHPDRPCRGCGLQAMNQAAIAALCALEPAENVHDTVQAKEG